MIIKVKSRKRGSFRQLLRYMIEGEERVPESRIITHNIEGESIDDWVAAFRNNEKKRIYRRSNSVVLTHEILSFHPDDTPVLTLESIENLTREYIYTRNPNGIYVGVIHLAQDHYHVHLCVSGIERHSGKAMRLAKAEFLEVKQRIQSYQREQYPELRHSLPTHGITRRPQLSSREYFSKVKNGRKPTREVVFEIVSQCLEAAESIDEVISQLEANELTPYYRGGKLYGVWYQGRKYRLARLGIQPDQLRELEQGRGDALTLNR